MLALLTTTARSGLRLLALPLFLAAAPAQQLEGAAVPSFATEVRPILADHCFACHGPDAATREAGLRLDQRESALADLGGYAAIVPDQPRASELLRRVRDRDDPMPPAEHEPLDTQQVATLERWIAAGAPYDRHWAYDAPTAPTVPPVRAADWSRDDVDRFVLHRLEQAGLRPAPAADPRTLVRRLSFDLLGLPPTDAQVRAFAEDPSDAAWARLVDELLASPHHAERLATFWFDLVRFADTIGIHADNPWNISPYRDWVLQAFRDNMPFDRFTVEQLAGDLLDEPTRSQQVAAAYNRLNLITREGGSQPKEFLIRYTADRVRNLGEVWLATSTGCCECHDHKFDPISTREFYELGAFFADIDQVGVYNSGRPIAFPPQVPVPNAAQAERERQLHDDLAAVSDELQADTAELAADLRGYLDELRRDSWQVLRPHGLHGTQGTRFELLADDSVLTVAEAPDQDDYELQFDLPAGRLAALRLQVLADPGLPTAGPGRADNGNFVLSEIEAWVGDRQLRFAASRASHEQPRYGVALTHDGKADRSGWAVLRGNDGQPATAVFDCAEPVTITPGTRLRVRLLHGYGDRHQIGRFRISVGARAGHPVLDPELRAAIDAAPTARSDAQNRRLRELHRASTPLLAAARARRDHLQRELDELRAAIPLVLQTRSVEPMETRVRPRGNWMDDSGDVVRPGVPAAFGLPLQVAGDRRPTRLDLARWLVDPRHPTTARVVVNRIWRLLLGRGLVTSLDDFGVQGTQPSDPELLDHLATRFVASGWNLRALIRELVLSSTYRQASWGADLDADDPRRITRFGQQSRFRLDAEFVRDQALAASGLLDRRIGGPSVFPYQPAGYWSHLNFPRRTYQPSTGADLYRRALYNHWQRQYLHPSLLAFDAPSRERCTAERARSNTPLAALVGLNDPIFVEAARVLAERVLHERPTANDELRIEHLWRLTLQRPPTPTESAHVTRLLAAHRAHYHADGDAAAQLLAIGAAPRDADLDPAEHAAWTSAARVLLNLHETITRD